MPTVFEKLPDLLLAIMGLLGLIRVRRYNNVFSAAAVLFGIDEEQLYREVELFIQQRWEEIFAQLDVHARGLDYFVGEAVARRPHPLLLEAACRLKGAQLTILDMERRHCDLFGQGGPVYTAAIEGGQFVALIGQPLEPWYMCVAREVEPGTSSQGQEQPRIVLPAQIVQKEVVLAPEKSEERAQAEHQPKASTAPTVNANEKAQWQEQLAARYREMLRPRSRASVPAERAPRKREVKRQPEFKPADITALPVHMTAELVAPATPPYIVQNNKILCRLAHCGVAEREFETVSAWKKHVALSKCHIEDAFCGTCGHHVIVPPGINGANIRAFITAHKKERCIGASNATLRERRTELARLEGLQRTTGHILLPDVEQAEAPADAEGQPPVVRRKRQYDTEEARRADICAAYLKRFKATDRELMAEIAMEYQLQLP